MHVPAFLEGRLVTGMRASLVPLQTCLDRLGQPQLQAPTLLISGTNGKGSVSTSLAACLRALGHSTGLFTSPSLYDLRELVRIDGRPLHPTYFAALCERVLAVASADGLTLFELITAVAFLAFAEASVAFAVVEVGMGGRHDATNLCEPVLSLITRVALDHVESLGGSLERIAFEKAGIARPGRCLLTGAEGEGLALLQQALALQPTVALRVAGQHFGWHLGGHLGGQGEVFWSVAELGSPVQQTRLKPSTALEGAHQQSNLLLVLEALACLEREGWLASGALSRPELEQGLAEVYLPGRLERLETASHHPVLLDGAHNPDGAQALAKSLRRLWAGRRGVLVLAVFSDKAVEALVQALVDCVVGVVCVQTSAPRCLAADVLASRVRACVPALEVWVAETVPAALARAEQALAGLTPCLEGLTSDIMRPGGAGVVVAGSLSLVAETHVALGSTRHLLEPGGWQP